MLSSRIEGTQAMRAIDQSMNLGAEREISEAKRDRVYCARAILEILGKPARLTPATPD